MDNPVSISIERDIDLYYIDCELEIAGQATWARYVHGADLALSINGINYQLMVTAQSKAVKLGHGYAETVEGELVGFASEIAASLAPDIVIDW